MKIKEAQKLMGLEDDIREYTLQRTKNLYRDTLTFAKECSALPKFYNKDFYVVIIARPNREPTGVDQDGNYAYSDQYIPFPRISCPTPVYRQIVYKYKHLLGDLEYMWTIPDEKRYQDILKNKQKYYDNKDTRRLCQFVVLMETGALLNWVKKENGELPDAVLSFKSKEEH